MRNTAAALLLLSLASAASAQEVTGIPASELRIVTVDSIKLDQGYFELVRHRNRIQAKRAMIDAEVKKLVADAQPLAEEIKKIQTQLNDPISDEAKRGLVAKYQSLARDVQQKDQEIKRYSQEKMAALNAEGQQEKNRLLAKVRDVIAKLSAERGIGLVLEHSSTETRAQVVWFSKPGMDMTEDVLAILNAGETPPEDPAPPATGDAPATPGDSGAATPIPAVPIEP